MLNSGKCPKCESTISSVKFEEVGIKKGSKTIFNGMSFLCPKCSTVLSVEINPILLNENLVKKIKGR